MFALAALICVGAFGVMLGQFAGAAKLSYSGFTGNSVVVGFIMILICAVALGPIFGIPLIIALLFHEFGQVMGFQMLGHRETCFRLIPCFDGKKISDTPLKSDTEAFFSAIMGPVFGLAPMVAAMALSTAISSSSPMLAHWFWILGATIGAVNFISLLPFRQFNGGTCTAAAVKSFWPALAPAMAVFMVAATASASVRTGSVALLILALVGAQGFWRRPSIELPEMGTNTGLTALAAYSFTLAAHFSAARLLFESYF